MTDNNTPMPDDLIKDFLEEQPKQKQSGLPEEKIEFVENILDNTPGAMNFEHVDGLFCALICGPEAVPFNEFLPYIFGSGKPEFSKEDMRKFIDILAEHWKHISDSMARGASYYPFLYADDQEQCAANNWADGFMLGVQLREAAWQELLNDTSETALLTPMIRLRNELSDINQGKGYTIDGQTRDELVELIVGNLLHLYNRHTEREEGEVVG